MKKLHKRLFLFILLGCIACASGKLIQPNNIESELGPLFYNNQLIPTQVIKKIDDTSFFIGSEKRDSISISKLLGLKPDTLYASDGMGGLFFDHIDSFRWIEVSYFDTIRNIDEITIQFGPKVDSMQLDFYYKSATKVIYSQMPICTPMELRDKINALIGDQNAIIIFNDILFFCPKYDVLYSGAFGSLMMKE